MDGLCTIHAGRCHIGGTSCSSNILSRQWRATHRAGSNIALLCCLKGQCSSSECVRFGEVFSGEQNQVTDGACHCIHPLCRTLHDRQLRFKWDALPLCVIDRQLALIALSKGFEAVRSTRCPLLVPFCAGQFEPCPIDGMPSRARICRPASLCMLDRQIVTIVGPGLESWNTVSRILTSAEVCISSLARKPKIRSVDCICYIASRDATLFMADY